MRLDRDVPIGKLGNSHNLCLASLKLSNLQMIFSELKVFSKLMFLQVPGSRDSLEDEFFFQ
jgi:hypothetical protein